MKKFNPIIEVENDNNYIPEVRQWSIEKYKLVGNYCNIFTAGMKNHWDQLVYIDLFAGAGFAKIIETGKVLMSSSFIALSIPNQFTKYILCEKNPKCIKALQIRTKKWFPNTDIAILNIDSNKDIDAIKKAIPKFSKENTLLPFCFVDPFSLDLRFSTIKSLGEILMDFLILQALYMDANRNLDKYLEKNNIRISEYLGISNWREEYIKNEKANKRDFVKFLADQYQEQMIKLGYQSYKQMHQIRSNIKNLPLYYLSFYSKHPRGNEFFKRIQKYCSPQLKLEF